MKMKKKILSAVLMSTVMLSVVQPLSTVSANTDSSIAAQDSKIANAQSASAQAQSQVDQLQSKVNDLQSKQASMTQEVKDLLKQQQDTSKQVQSLNKDIQDRSTALEAQARSAQVNGTATSYLDAIINSRSLTDVFEKVTAMATVATANKDMINQQQADEQNMQAKLKDNMDKYAKATKLQQDLASQSSEITTQQAQLKVAQLSYQETITTAQGEKANLQAQKAQAQAAADAAAQAQNNSNQGGTISTPTPPTSSSNIPKPSPGGTSASNPYPAGQCTAFVWQYFHDNYGKTIQTYMGNAGDWVVYANSGAAAGTIAVFPPGVQGAGGVGHVAVVTSVSGSTMTVIEGNFNGGWGTTRVCSTAGVSFIRP